MHTLTKRNQPVGFNNLFDELFEGYFGDWKPARTPSLKKTIPAVNVKENENAFLLELAAPGLKKENFNLEINNNSLTIEATTESKETEEKYNYSRKEFSYESFKRSFTLPKDKIKIEDIEANYSDGVLVVSLPKKPASETNGPRLVEVQ